jgi:hypothetical protein
MIGLRIESSILGRVHLTGLVESHRSVKQAQATIHNKMTADGEPPSNGEEDMSLDERVAWLRERVSGPWHVMFDGLRSQGVLIFSGRFFVLPSSCLLLSLD